MVKEIRPREFTGVSGFLSPFGQDYIYVPPTPTVPVIISVTLAPLDATVGVEVTASVTRTGYPFPTLSYQWKLDGGNVGTNSSNYTPVATGDLTCVVTATNSEGSDNLESDPVTIGAALAAPVNTVAPVISGSTSIPSTLTATTGTWTGNPAPTYGYEWFRDGVTPVGTGSTYATTIADDGLAITCLVTASNSEGSASAGSNTITPGIAATAPAQMAAPTFSGVSYETATVIRGTAPADGGSAITGYRMQYRPTSGGAWTEVNPFGATEDLTGLYNDTEYEAQQRAVNGVGAGDWSISGTFTTDQLPDILGNVGGTVDIIVDDGTFFVIVSGSDYAHQNGTFGPFDTADLDSGPVLVVAPVISGSAVEGSTLTAEPGIWVHDAADGTTTVSAIWQADGVDITYEDGLTYVTVGGDVGALITYEEEATNDAGTRTSDSNGITVTASGAWSLTGGVGGITVNTHPTPPATPTVGDGVGGVTVTG